MKFLIYSNSPQAPTGYGVQCAQLAANLKREGHDVAVACTYGHQIGVKNWPTAHGNVILYPSGYVENSLDILRQHADHFFEGDPKGGWIIPLTDMWVLNPVPLDDYQILAWTPVDHFPCPEGVIRFFHKNPQAIPVAMSRFGEKMLVEAGLTPEYAPLAVDVGTYRPVTEVEIGGAMVPVREMAGIPDDAFAVLMVAMNKDPRDRKGFNEAFRAFGAFWKEHQDAVLVVHSERLGLLGSGINLNDLARHAAIPPHALIFTADYSHRLGWSPQMMAGLFSACDVYLAPSKGEGFCVPMVEAQACGIPVIASDFSAQSELIGAGWSVSGQLDWDAPQSASYLAASTIDVYYKLNEAYETVKAKRDEVAAIAVEFASRYAVDHVFDAYWKPIIDSLDPTVPVAADKPIMESVDVIVPFMRKANADRLFESFEKYNDGTAVLSIHQCEETQPDGPLSSYAQAVNSCYLRHQYRFDEDKQKWVHTQAGDPAPGADWVVVVGDDVEFTEGWIDEIRKLSDRYDVIGINDSEAGRVRNPDVAAGRHADHFAIRRTYIEDEGACLDGPGVLMPECYGHWFTDKEVIGLARARGVFGMAFESRVIHHHPGFDGDEAARKADQTYMKAVDSAEKDRKTFLSRAPLIEGHRVQRGRVRA